jgi:hypothetical protein
MQAVSAGGARGPFSYRRKQEKKEGYGSQNQNLHEILDPFNLNCGCQIHSTIACHILNLSFCVCYILIFHMY